MQVLVVPPKDPNADYYEQLCHLSIANIVMQTQIKKLMTERQDSYQKLRTQNKESEGGAKPHGEEDSVVSSSVPAPMTPSAVPQPAPPQSPVQVQIQSQNPKESLNQKQVRAGIHLSC